MQPQETMVDRTFSGCSMSRNCQTKSWSAAPKATKKATVKTTHFSCQSERMPITAKNGSSQSRYQGWMIGERMTSAVKAQVMRCMRCSWRPRNISHSTTRTESSRPAVLNVSSTQWPGMFSESRTTLVASAAMPTGDHGTEPVPVPSMTVSQPQPNPLRTPTTAITAPAMPAVSAQKVKRRVQDAPRPAQSRPMKGNRTRVMGLMPTEAVTSSTPSSPRPVATHQTPARARPTMRESLCPEATKLMMNSGLATVIHWARAPSVPSRRASSGTKTMISTTPATATRRNRKIARSGDSVPAIRITASSIQRNTGP